LHYRPIAEEACMAKNRICRECNSKQDEGAKFPKWGRLCAKCLAKRDKQRYGEDKERILAQKKQYRSENKEEINAKQTKYAAQYYKDNKEAILEQRRQEYSSEHPPRPCIDCGEPMPKRAVKYCTTCREAHDALNAKLGMRRHRKKVE
jgi:hypothetical protein